MRGGGAVAVTPGGRVLTAVETALRVELGSTVGVNAVAVTCATAVVGVLVGSEPLVVVGVLVLPMEEVVGVLVSCAALVGVFVGAETPVVGVLVGCSLSADVGVFVGSSVGVNEGRAVGGAAITAGCEPFAAPEAGWLEGRKGDAKAAQEGRGARSAQNSTSKVK